MFHDCSTEISIKFPFFPFHNLSFLCEEIDSRPNRIDEAFYDNKKDM